MSAQASLDDYPTGGTSNADRRQERDTARQRPLNADADEAAAVDVPDAVGAFERVTARHGGEVVRWSDGVESVSVVRIIGDGPAFEVSAADASVPNPGRLLVDAPDRAIAIDEACAYMRASE